MAEVAVVRGDLAVVVAVHIDPVDRVALLVVHLLVEVEGAHRIADLDHLHVVAGTAGDAMPVAFSSEAVSLVTVFLLYAAFTPKVQLRSRVSARTALTSTSTPLLVIEPMLVFR